MTHYILNIPIKVAIDQGADLPKLRKLRNQGVIEISQESNNEQQWNDIDKHPGIFTIGLSIIGGEHIIANNNVMETQKVLEATTYYSKNYKDFNHLYSADLNQNKYFITGNPKDFINNGKREKLEGILNGIKIRLTNEFITELVNYKIIDINGLRLQV